MSIVGVTVNDEAIGSVTAAKENSQEQPHVWEELVMSIRNGKYRDDYELDELIPISLGRFEESHARIVAFDEDAINGSDRNAAVSFILAMPLPERRQMNPCWAKEDPEDNCLYVPGTGAIDGWMSCDLRKWLNEEVLPEFPPVVRDNIVPVLKTSRTFTAKSQIFDVVTEDKLWIPSRREIFGPGRFTELSGPVYSECFGSNDDRVMLDGASSASWWWLRSASSSTSFANVSNDGSGSSDYASNEGGVVVGFCL